LSVGCFAKVARTLDADPRMTVMQKIWFEDKDVFDIGCNEGHVTISLGILTFSHYLNLETV
jgi:hypothetical protein